MRLWTSWVTALSLTLLLPLCYWYQSRYIISRKVIDGKKCYFNGKLLFMYILYAIFLTVDIGIVLLIQFLYKKSGIPLFESIPANIISSVIVAITHFLLITIQEKYVQAHTHFVDEEMKKSGYRFNFFLLLVKNLLIKLLNTMLLGLLYPITRTILYSYNYKRGYYDEIDLTYKFSLKKLYPRWFLDWFLIIITLTFYLPAAENRLDEKCQRNAHLKAKQ